jgi:chromosome segregation ATPase
MPDSNYRRPVKKSVIRSQTNPKSKTSESTSKPTTGSEQSVQPSDKSDAQVDIQKPSNEGQESTQLLYHQTLSANNHESVSIRKAPFVDRPSQSIVFDIEYHEEHVDYLESQLDIFEEKIDVLQKEKDRFTAKLSKQKEKISRLESIMKDLEESNKSYKSDITENKKILSRHNQEMVKQTKLIEKLESQIAALKVKREAHAQSNVMVRSDEGGDVQESIATANPSILLAKIEQKEDIVDELYRMISDLKAELAEK